jgi:DNA primase
MLDGQFDTRTFLREQVYPALDAAGAGLLDGLNPKKRSNNYLLTCPGCQKREAYYYIGSSHILCGRKTECKFTQSIWDYVKDSKNLNQAETFAELCAAAGVERPAVGNGADVRTPTEESVDKRIARVAKDVFRDLLRQDQEAMAYLQGPDRLLTPAQIAELPLGYYPNAATVVKALEAAGIKIEDAQRWGLLPADRERESPFSRRVVSYWPIKDGTWRLVGRAIDKDRKPKYLYASGDVGFDRTVPYNWKQRGSRSVMVCVEGYFDVLSYELMGIPACGLGGANVTATQMAFFKGEHVRLLIHVIDGDTAGRDGGATSIEVCESEGLPVLIGVCPPDEDADSLRVKGREAEARAVVDRAVPGGEFLATELLRLMDVQGPKAALSRGQIWRALSSLVPDSKMAFDMYYNRLGLQPEDTRIAAVRMVSNMAMHGVPLDDALKSARDRYGWDLRVTAVE